LYYTVSNQVIKIGYIYPMVVEKCEGGPMQTIEKGEDEEEGLERWQGVDQT
jgi:hypothetical protein